MSTRAFRNQPSESNCFHPRLIGRKGAVCAEHYLAAEAGADVLRRGGNAIDAAVAAVLVEGLINPQMNSIGGECPLLIWSSEHHRVVVINGNTAAPGLATPEAYMSLGFDEVPAEGILAAGVPATLGSLVTALRLFGTKTFEDVASAASDLAHNGFPVHRGLLFQEKFGIRDLEEKFRTRWPGSRNLYLPEGDIPKEGAILRNTAFAEMLDYLSSLERTKATREEGLRMVLGGFYRGEVAAKIDSFSNRHAGLLRYSDLEVFETKVEEPLSVEYLGNEIFKCGPWNQGPAMLQTLRILEQFDLKSMGHNSDQYVHHVAEAIKLAYADREQYYADPSQTTVPIEGLISREYGSLRAPLIDPDKANPELRPGDPIGRRAVLPVEDRIGGRSWGPGTVHVDVIDGLGNVVAATPSGGWIMSSEVMPDLGFPLGNRLMTFYLQPAYHPNRIAPFKRPRTTISPSLARTTNGDWIAFGSMGGDQQDQWQIQFFLNVTVFGMPLNQAIEAAKFSSEHFPGFFAPHTFYRNRLRVEPKLGEQTILGLRARGHDVDIGPDWSEGYILAARQHGEDGTVEAAYDPRGAKSDIFAAAARCW